jgi:hypothetical protein
MKLVARVTIVKAPWQPTSRRAVTSSACVAIAVEEVASCVTSTFGVSMRAFTRPDSHSLGDATPPTVPQALRARVHSRDSH